MTPSTKPTTTRFNERQFLIRSLLLIFLIQFASTGAQFFNCFRAANSAVESEKSNLVCTQASQSFSETSKLALTTLLALLVPAAAAEHLTPEQSTRRRKSPEDSES